MEKTEKLDKVWKRGDKVGKVWEKNFPLIEIRLFFLDISKW